jgi:hypothetical protein
MKVNHISNEHMGSIFRVEEYAKQYEPTWKRQQETSVKCHQIIRRNNQKTEIFNILYFFIN